MGAVGRTTAASKPTIWSTVNSEVLIVGIIHPKKAWCACASCGEKPVSGISTEMERVWGRRTLELCTGSKDKWPARAAVGKEKKRGNADGGRDSELGGKPWPLELACGGGQRGYESYARNIRSGGEPGGRLRSSSAAATAWARATTRTAAAAIARSSEARSREVLRDVWQAREDQTKRRI